MSTKISLKTNPKPKINLTRKAKEESPPEPTNAESQNDLSKEEKAKLQLEAIDWINKFVTPQVHSSPRDHVAVLINPDDNKYVVPFIAQIYGDSAQMGGFLHDGRMRILIYK